MSSKLSLPQPVAAPSPLGILLAVGERLPISPNPDPVIENSLLGFTMPAMLAGLIEPTRKELQPYIRSDGSISFRRELVRDEFEMPHNAESPSDHGQRVLVPRKLGQKIVDEYVVKQGAATLGRPAVRRALRNWTDANPIKAADQFAADPIAQSVLNNITTRIRLGARMGLLEAVVMLAAMFPQEQLLIFCADSLRRRDLIAQLIAGGITATDLDDRDARVLVMNSTNELANPIRVQHRRIVVLDNEGRLTAPLARELAWHPDTSRLVVLSSLSSVDTADDRKRIETWFGKAILTRHIATAAPREIRGTFAVLKQGRRQESGKPSSNAQALRYHVIDNKRAIEAIGRLLCQNPGVWADRLASCDTAIVLGTASPVVIVCGTLQHAVALLKQTKRAVLATSDAKIARQAAPTLRGRIRPVRSALEDADRVIVPLHDVRHLKTIGSLFRVDSLPGPLPISDRQHERWGLAGDSSPLHVIDLNRIDFDLGRSNASLRAACYAADLMPFAHAPKFKPHRMPPVRYEIGCGYGTKHIVYHRRSKAERTRW